MSDIYKKHCHEERENRSRVYYHFMIIGYYKFITLIYNHIKVLVDGKFLVIMFSGLVCTTPHGSLSWPSVVVNVINE